MAAGLAVAAAGFAVMTQVEVDSGLAVLVTATVIFSLGLAPLFTLANDLIIGTAPPERAGAASAISETGAELGGALSIAVIGTLGTAVYRSQVADEHSGRSSARGGGDGARHARRRGGGERRAPRADSRPICSTRRARPSPRACRSPPSRARHRGCNGGDRGDLDAERAAAPAEESAAATGERPAPDAGHRARLVLTARSQTAAITRACGACSRGESRPVSPSRSRPRPAAQAPAPLSGRTAEPAPVASLEPRQDGGALAPARRLAAAAAQQQTDCRPLRGVFYAATDFLRLATKLAATPSPCAEYYISVPPLVSDKTLPRPNAAPRIRALGPNFHAMAEIHFATWTRWVASTGSSWHTAGVTARQRMAAAGFDVAQGDTWVFNELTTAVRRGTGNARANVREFLRGLYEGDGSRPTRGAVFVIGFGQRSSDVSLYQTNLQNWLADSAFWTDMNTYVSDWTQEAYGDVRSWAVPGAPTSVRRDSLNDYLQHKLVLAGAGPPEIETARAYLRATYSPLANAAWERDTGYGWTMVSAQQMAGYVSAQVHALRYFSATTGQSRDHWGFAWAPRNAAGIPAARVRGADGSRPRPARGGGA